MRPKTEFRFQNTALSLARFDGVGRSIQNAALSLAHFPKPNSDICDVRGPLQRLLRGVVTFENDEHTGALPGRLVRPSTRKVRNLVLENGPMRAQHSELGALQTINAHRNGPMSTRCTHSDNGMMFSAPRITNTQY